MRKVLMFILIITVFSSCSNIEKEYTYHSLKNIEKISIYGKIMDEYDENSPLAYIKISGIRKLYKDKIDKDERLFFKNIQIEENGKIYEIPNSDIKEFIDEDEIYIHILRVDIKSENFILYVGDIYSDKGKITNIPPLHFEKEIYIRKHGMFNAINPTGKIERYSSSFKDYKLNGWDQENKISF